MAERPAYGLCMEAQLLSQLASGDFFFFIEYFRPFMQIGSALKRAAIQQSKVNKN
jgi:hypothetical protein